VTASHSAKSGLSLHPDAPLTIGFYVNWDDASMSSLRQNLASLDVLIPEWLHLAGADGSIALDTSPIGGLRAQLALPAC